jgi:hypothetical protein
VTNTLAQTELIYYTGYRFVYSYHWGMYYYTFYVVIDVAVMQVQGLP